MSLTHNQKRREWISRFRKIATESLRATDFDALATYMALAGVRWRRTFRFNSSYHIIRDDRFPTITATPVRSGGGRTVQRIGELGEAESILRNEKDVIEQTVRPVSSPTPESLYEVSFHLMYILACSTKLKKPHGSNSRMNRMAYDKLLVAFQALPNTSERFIVTYAEPSVDIPLLGGSTTTIVEWRKQHQERLTKAKIEAEIKANTPQASWQWLRDHLSEGLHLRQ